MTVETTPAGDNSAASTPVLPTPPASTIEGNPAPSAAAPAEQVKTEPGTPEAAANEQDSGQGEKDEQKPKVKRSVQERIDQMAMQVRVANEESAALRAELERLRQPPKQPDRELSFDEQEAQRLRQVVREERSDEIESELRNRELKAASSRQQMFEAKAEAVADRMPDLLEKFYSVPCTQFAADFIAESEKAAEIAYFLGSNPHEASRISKLPDTRQAVELARLEARLNAAPQVRKTSAAPNPPPMVGGGASPGPKDPSTMSMAEYKEWRRKGGGK